MSASFVGLSVQGVHLIEKWNDRVRQRMKEFGMSQRDLAEILGLTPGAVSNYVNGSREPNMEQLASIIRELGVTADWVVLGIKNKAKGPAASRFGVSPYFANLSARDKSKINTAIQILALSSTENEH